jgi:hypothetical protein
MKSFPRILACCLLAAGLAGCAGLHAPPAPVPPPAGIADLRAAARTGFQAVYEGELRIWGFSWSLIWYVAVPPGGETLSAAVLNPLGVKILQLREASAGVPACEPCVPGAERLTPYGMTLWQALKWSLADTATPEPASWSRRGRSLAGATPGDPVRVDYEANAETGALRRKDVSRDGAARFTIRYSAPQRMAGRAFPERLDIRCRAPRCRLTLRLKHLRWREDARGTQADGN